MNETMNALESSDFEQLLALARKAAAAGATEVMKGWDRPMDVTHKGVVDLVTEYDKASEETIFSIIRETRPDDAILAEEGGLTKGHSRVSWLVDPLDGTTNFSHGLPLFGVSVAALEEGVPVAGVVHLPAMGWEFYAARGMGAFMNEVPMHVSSISNLTDALAVTGFPYSRRRQAHRIAGYVEHFLTRVQGLRRLGAAAVDLCLVARGWLDVFWEFELNAWDLAAGIVILQEAGGLVTDWSGGPVDQVLQSGQVAASNGTLHAELTASLEEMVANDMRSEGGEQQPGK